jgi:tetratricopeptide (TPR) repeat protein
MFVQWRISRLARMRAEREDRAGNTDLAMRDVNLSDRLDHNNASLNRILRDMDKARERTLRSVTPRESLQMALARADFTLARRFAEPILKGDPDDPNANFGVGMSYFTQKQWARAEEFLRKCLIKKPKEPAVWNNLAMICLYTERYDEGLKLAQKALEIIPESAAVKDTIKQLKEAKEKAREEAASKKKGDKKDAAPSAQQTTEAKAPPAAEKAQTPAAAKPSVAEKKPSPAAPAVDKPTAPVLRMAPSPREELDAAIARGDYVAAAQYAKPILSITPDDPYANFAVGMDHFGKRAWEPAEKHLRKCVKQKPDQPVFLNNLAVVLLYRGRYDEALAHARRALKILPDSTDVQDTIRQIEKARDADGAKKQEAKPAPKKKAEAKPPAKKKPEAKKPDAKKPEAKKPAEKPAKAPENPPEGDGPDALVPSLPAAPETM